MIGRCLTPGEVDLARSVFGRALDTAPVRLQAAGFGGFAVTLGSWITFPPGSARDDFAAASLAERAWLIHELTHVWQFQTAPLRTLAGWAKTAATGGYGPGLPGYRYDLPVRFDAFGLERQARVVEHAFLLREGAWPVDLPEGARPTDYAGVTPFPALG